MVGVPRLGEVTLRPVFANWLAFALLDTEHVDNRRPEEKHEQKRCHDGATGSEGYVGENIERP